jgi:Flp pilus assembly pilin Flp
MNRITAMVSAYLMALLSTLKSSTIMTRPTPALTRGARALSFIEYALLAAIIIIVSFVFKEQLSTLFSNMLSSVQKLFDKSAPTG